MKIADAGLQPGDQRNEEGEGDHVCGVDPFDLVDIHVELMADHGQGDIDDAAVDGGHGRAEHEGDEDESRIFQHTLKVAIWGPRTGGNLATGAKSGYRGREREW